MLEKNRVENGVGGIAVLFMGGMVFWGALRTLAGRGKPPARVRVTPPEVPVTDGVAPFQPEVVSPPVLTPEEVAYLEGPYEEYERRQQEKAVLAAGLYREQTRAEREAREAERARLQALADIETARLQALPEAERAAMLAEYGIEQVRAGITREEYMAEKVDTPDPFNIYTPDMVTHLGVTMTREQFLADFPPGTVIVPVVVPEPVTKRKRRVAPVVVQAEYDVERLREERQAQLVVDEAAERERQRRLEEARLAKARTDAAVRAAQEEYAARTVEEKAAYWESYDVAERRRY